MHIRIVSTCEPVCRVSLQLVWDQYPAPPPSPPHSVRGGLHDRPLQEETQKGWCPWARRACQTKPLRWRRCSHGAGGLHLTVPESPHSSDVKKKRLLGALQYMYKAAAVFAAAQPSWQTARGTTPSTVNTGRLNCEEVSPALWGRHREICGCYLWEVDLDQKTQAGSMRSGPMT